MNEIILIHIWEKHKEKRERHSMQNAKYVFHRLIHSKVNFSNDKKLIDRNWGKIKYITVI